MPRRLTRPTVGLRPTSPFTAEGQMMLPSVSVPTPNAARLAAIAVPVPELEPQGLRSSAYGFFVWPPRELQPDEELLERKFAHSLRFVLPRITAPAPRSRVTRKASCFGRFSASASEPAELTRPATSTLSLIRTGRPCSGPRIRPALRSASSAAASARARGLSSITAFSAGPASSTAAMRSRYACVKSLDVSLPSAMRPRACVAPKLDDVDAGSRCRRRLWRGSARGTQQRRHQHEDRPVSMDHGFLVSCRSDHLAGPPTDEMAH